MSSAPTTARGSSAAVTVMLSGIATTLATLAVVYVLENGGAEISVMGWYLDWVIPAGAILAGLAASSGYAIGSWLGGVKISKGLLASVVGVQIVAYFAARYIEFMAFAPVYGEGTPVGFPAYFDWSTRAFAWIQEDGSFGEPFGVWGYGFRALEIVGFSLGSLIAPLALRGRSYCDPCARYMKTKEAAVVPASVPTVKIKKRDVQARAAHDAEQQAAHARAMEQLAALHEKVEANDATAFRDRLKEFAELRKQSMKLPVRIAIQVSRCPRCEAGEMRSALWTGQGQHQRCTEIARTALPQFFARSAID